MKVGIFVSEAWGAGSTIEEVRERSIRAEALGFASAWVPYLPWAADAMASMQAAGEVTERIEMGAAVIPTPFFHPLALARQAATVQAARIPTSTSIWREMLFSRTDIYAAY